MTTCLHNLLQASTKNAQKGLLFCKTFNIVSPSRCAGSWWDPFQAQQMDICLDHFFTFVQSFWFPCTRRVVCQARDSFDVQRLRTYRSNLHKRQWFAHRSHVNVGPILFIGPGHKWVDAGFTVQPGACVPPTSSPWCDSCSLFQLAVVILTLCTSSPW